ncbi:2-deoxyglucose-6-phosphate phosphatase, putative [Pediculus humanus corporis]|uniref:pseudouridine 5'-phosphatase n=1 Tax=Pediculus humanus subsp. corporis TaxID=121224 RepID=E0VBZ4_PEDHC|nr:2-deoxyglucose-6-phosphate phosphatase, putative [Pediculus humanus corporis]EEB10900.1 2-deoxyglucose-6-phosphate phosphatase, putative [Pediculus humanus corporis]
MFFKIFLVLLNLGKFELKNYPTNESLYNCNYHLLLLNSAEGKKTSRNTSSKPNIEKMQNSKKYNPVTHVIFDLDGLLLDTETIYKDIISKIAESYNKKYTKEIQIMVLGTTEQSTAKIVVENCGLPISSEEFLEQFRGMQVSYLPHAKLMKGAEKLVKHLHENNVPIAVATSSSQNSVDVKTKAHKSLFDLFHHIVTGSSDPAVKQGKPAPDIFFVCADRFPDKPKYEKCLVFEDAPNGVTGAIAAGMQTVMVPDSFLPQDKTSHATLVLNSLLDFKPELFGLPSYK